MAEDNKIIAELIVEGVERFKAQLAESASGASKFRAEIDKTTESLKQLEAENKTNTAEYQKLKTKLTELNSEYDTLIKTNVNYKKELKLTRQEIISLTLELNKMKDAGKQGTVEFKVLEGKIKELTNIAGNLDDVISDVSGTIKNAGSDTRGLDRTLRVVQSVGAGFQLAQGAAALFGSENKELANALIKLNGIMAVTSSLQQIQDELLKEDSVLTGVATLAKRAYAGAVAYATGAMTLFRTVMISLGIGAFIAAIGLLVANWDKLKLAIAGATDKLKDLADQRAKESESADKQIQDLQTELKYKIAIGQLTQKQALEESIKKQTEAQKLKLASYKAENEVLKQIEKSYRNAKEAFGIREGATKEQLDAQAEKVRKADLEFKNYTISIKDTQKELEELNKKEIDKPIKETSKSIKDVTKSVKELKDLLPIKFDIEPNLDKFDEYLSSLITTAETQLKSLFTAELLLGNNPQDNPQIRYLITQIQKYKDELDLAKLKFDALNPTEIKPIETQEVTDTVNQLQGISKIDVKKGKKKTFLEALYGTQDENDEAFKNLKKTASEASQFVSDLYNIANGISGVVTQQISIRANADLELLEKKKKQGLISEKEYEKESARIKNEAAEKQRNAEIAMAVAKVPMVVLQALATAPNPVIGGVLAAVAGGLALAQVAILSASPLPKFKEGGSVEKRFKGSGYVIGKSHEQGGVNAELEGNEYVVKGNAVKKYGVRFLDEVNSLKFNPILSMPKKALTYHKKDTKMYEHMAIIASYLKQGYKEESKGNNILKEISSKINNKREYV